MAVRAARCNAVGYSAKGSGMEDSVIWAVAIGSGVLGLLLLGVAGVAVLYWNGVSRRPRTTAPDDHKKAQAGAAAATATAPAEGKRPPVSAAGPQPASSPGLWLWLKAWLFAILHASTVSVVVGGITFLEDLSKASEEIQSVGRVSFPKQLLPGPLTGTASHRQLSQASEATGWEVVGASDEGKRGETDS